MFEFSRLPIWLIGAIIVGGFVGLSCGGLLLYRRVTHGRLNLPEDMNNDVIFFASAISVFYSLTVGLIAVGVWTNYAEVQNIVAGESASMAALFRDVNNFPEPQRSALTQGLTDYMEFVIDQEWPAQYVGDIIDGGTRMLNVFEKTLYSFEPQTDGQAGVHAEALQEYNEMITLRRERIDGVEGSLPGIMWAIVLIGAALSISVTYLLKIQFGVHLVLTAFLAAFIGLVVFTVYGLDRPLSGPLAIGPEDYRLILERLMLLR
jgi:hypothetical protein